MRKQIQKQYLDKIKVQVEDNTLTSMDYFRITYCESEFRLGKNLLRFKGTPNVFTEDTQIGIEILDYNNDPIYYESFLENNVADISIYITSDLPPGQATIILCGCINGSRVFNLRWHRKISINVEKETDTEIVYTKLPTVEINASTASYVDNTFTGNTRIVTSSFSEIDYFQRNGTAFIVTSSLSNQGFNTNEIESFMFFDTTEIENISPQPSFIPSYVSAPIKLEVISSGIAKLQENIQLNTIPFKWLPADIHFSSITIQTEQNATATSSTENKHNLLTAYFSELEPKSGFVSKIRSFYKSLGQNEWQFSNITNITGSEQGFTPTEYTASLIIPTSHRNDTIDFRFEFLNNQGIASRQELVVKDYKFQGGNTYIGGDDNLMTGSLFVSGQTGTGIEISGRNMAAMLRSIGYKGFANALTGSGSAGFVLYSGSIQPILESVETYGGVGFELVANTSSYFKYKTDGGGLLDIRTDNFYIGNQNTFISGANNNIEILVRDPVPPLTKFHLQNNGVVTASALVAFTGSSDSNKNLMLDTIRGLVDGKNIGRNIKMLDYFYIPYTDTSTLPPQNKINSTSIPTALNTGSLQWTNIFSSSFYTLPFENTILVMGNATFLKTSTNAMFPLNSSIDDAKVCIFLRSTITGISTSSFANFGANDGIIITGNSGSLAPIVGTALSTTAYTIPTLMGSGSFAYQFPFKVSCPVSAQLSSDRLIYHNLDYAVVRLNSNTGTTLDITFESKLINLNTIITRTLAIDAISGTGAIASDYNNDNYPTA